MNQKQYPRNVVSQILEEWEYNQTHAQCPMSMRRFCEDWNIPRSTLQGWLGKQSIDPLPVTRFYGKPVEASDPSKARINKEVLEVLRMLASELSAISTDLDEVLDKL